MVSSSKADGAANKRAGPIVKVQDEKLNKAINGDDSEFVAIQGWFWRWKRRHGISHAKVVGEKRSGDAEGATIFLQNLSRSWKTTACVQSRFTTLTKPDCFSRCYPIVRWPKK